MKMRICVIIDIDGNWVASGYARQEEKEVEYDLEYTVGPQNEVHWIEVDLDVPSVLLTPVKPTPFPRLRGHHA